ncbi:hypothetical protein GCM10007199_25320 [Fictibacillus barbaricus]|uniref:ATP-sulfurylase PUA-like domain-containing protein n=1 Tax=Fictibacillus barbaricus TaxID=182136 RepID=A0ABS2ZFF9_9BACL|nr:hypothetical protein [Fictibacillus barbaricus]GGB58390.1 hypothetical protein GCM10007199_25320 [Fictibacillus barbaricus]
MANGAFSPLDSFMDQKDYLSVLYHMRLTSRLPWSSPITLPVSEQKAKELIKISEAKLIYENVVYGRIEITDIYQPDHLLESRLVYRTENSSHPDVQNLKKRGNWYVGGRITMVDQPPRKVAPFYYLDPLTTRE